MNPGGGGERRAGGGWGGNDDESVVGAETPIKRTNKSTAEGASNHERRALFAGAAAAATAFTTPADHVVRCGSGTLRGTCQPKRHAEEKEEEVVVGWCWSKRCPPRWGPRAALAHPPCRRPCQICRTLATSPRRKGR